MSDTIETAYRKAAEAMAEQLEYEVMGAWMAGYDYLHVYNPVNVHKFGEYEKFAVRQYVLPSYSDAPPRPVGYDYSHTKLLHELTPEKVREARTHGTIHD